VYHAVGFRLCDDREIKWFRQVQATVSVTPYVLCGAGGSIQLNLSLGRLSSIPLHIAHLFYL
jgi:hypothetical protein